jgi:hypothetical protein
MFSSPSILIYGHDPHLLETRRWILERVGYWTWSASDTCEVARIIANHRVDLLIPCHSLSTEECERALSLVRTREPRSQSLILTSVRAGPCSADLNYKILDTRDGPAKFLAEVTRLIPPQSNSHFTYLLAEALPNLKVTCV